MNILKEYLLPKSTLAQEFAGKKNALWRAARIEGRASYYNQIRLLTFVLMPNHFHLQLKQFEKRTMEKFVKSIQIRYSLYFNKKYNRVGTLFQGRYRGILIRDDQYCYIVSRYIHKNPLDILGRGAVLKNYPYSSYPTYCRVRNLVWIDMKPILTLFDRLSPSLARQRYLDFVENKL